MIKLPEALLRRRTVEGERIRYKVGWNPDDESGTNIIASTTKIQLDMMDIHGNMWS